MGIAIGTIAIVVLGIVIYGAVPDPDRARWAQGRLGDSLALPVDGGVDVDVTVTSLDPITADDAELWGVHEFADPDGLHAAQRSFWRLRFDIEPREGRLERFMVGRSASWVLVTAAGLHPGTMVAVGSTPSCGRSEDPDGAGESCLVLAAPRGAEVLAVRFIGLEPPGRNLGTDRDRYYAEWIRRDA